MWEAAGEPQGLRFKTRWVPHFSRSLREVGFVTFFRSKPPTARVLDPSANFAGRSVQAGQLTRVGNFCTVPRVAGLDSSGNSATLGNSQVVVVLKVQPELRRQAKVLS